MRIPSEAGLALANPYIQPSNLAIMNLCLRMNRFTYPKCQYAQTPGLLKRDVAPRGEHLLSHEYEIVP
jgi:hypothetical protein